VPQPDLKLGNVQRLSTACAMKMTNHPTTFGPRLGINRDGPLKSNVGAARKGEFGAFLVGSKRAVVAGVSGQQRFQRNLWTNPHSISLKINRIEIVDIQASILTGSMDHNGVVLRNLGVDIREAQLIQ
jgi:hypothetical protein